MSNQAEKLDQKYWNDRWENQQLGWDIGYPSTPIKTFIDGYPNKEAAILIPGCGNAHEAAYLLEQGFQNVTVIDIAAKAVENVHNRFEANPHIQIILGDFFDHQGKYDLILEQTFFCALDPNLRPAYVQKMSNLLQDHGLLVGLLFQVDFQKPGPPFGGEEAAYRELFKEYFNLLIMEPCRNSIPPRQGTELFIKLEQIDAAH